MQCPKCKGLLRPLDFMEGFELDFCQGCKGVWYDKGELAFHMELEHDIPDWKERKKGAFPTAFLCPRCKGQSLEEVRYIAGEDLLIDRCAQCHGLFLDKGEVLKLERLVVKSESMPRRLARALRDLDQMGYQVLPKNPST